jgi:hypothetical protein
MAAHQAIPPDETGRLIGVDHMEMVGKLAAALAVGLDGERPPTCSTSCHCDGSAERRLTGKDRIQTLNL